MDTKPCRCNCGYKCGGPGRCKLSFNECMQQKEGHWERDCEHKFEGALVSVETAFGYCESVICSKCGISAVNHDIVCGP